MFKLDSVDHVLCKQCGPCFVYKVWNILLLTVWTMFYANSIDHVLCKQNRSCIMQTVLTVYHVLCKQCGPCFMQTT